jgi:hypothetical protein
MAGLSKERIAELRREAGQNTRPTKPVEWSLTVAEARALVDMASRSVSWTRIDYDDPDTLPRDDSQVLILVDYRGHGPGVVRARWDPERDSGARWYDDEEDGTGSQFEFELGQVSHWAPWPEPPKEAASGLARGGKGDG